MRPHVLRVARRQAPLRDCLETLTTVGQKVADRGLAQAQRLVEHRVKYRRKVTSGRIDDLQDLGGRGLLVERFSEFNLTLSKLTLQIGYELRGIG